MLKTRFTSLFILYLLISPVQASPTSADFTRCVRSASIDLEYCITRKGTGQSDACWEKSKQYFDACKKGVLVRYSREYQQEKIKAAREREKAMKQQQSQQKKP